MFVGHTDKKITILSDRMIGIKNRYGKRVVKCRSRFVKRHAVFLQIAASLFFIPLKFNRHNARLRVFP